MAAKKSAVIVVDMRHLDVTIATDGVAHIHEDLVQAALKMMERNMRAQLAPAADCRLEA
jgi:hypothetical protein